VNALYNDVEHDTLTRPPAPACDCALDAWLSVHVSGSDPIDAHQRVHAALRRVYEGTPGESAAAIGALKDAEARLDRLILRLLEARDETAIDTA
ncbi:MAG: hypothetical protein M0Z76_10605, partial [Gammaproteobacteria bacterium]|nr:hypothetical protein [Gammaproteobacteria bacterium]